MWFIALAGSAVAPSFFLFWYINSRDVHPEPKAMLAGTFGLGAVVAIPVVILVLAMQSVVAEPGSVWGKAAFTAFLGAAIPEEGFKFLVLMTFCYRSRHFDEPFDGIVYGATASLGFATLENVLYVYQGGLGVAALRAFTAVPGHAFCGVVMGYYVGRAKFAREGKVWLTLQGLLYAIVLHGLYDLFLMTRSAWALAALPVLIGEVVWGIIAIRKMKWDGFIPAVSYDQKGKPVDPAGLPVAFPAPGFPVVDAERPLQIAEPAPDAPEAPQAPVAAAVAPAVAPQPATAAPMAAATSRSRKDALKLVFGSVLGSVGALFAIAAVAALFWPSPGEELTMFEGIVLAILSPTGIVGGVLLFHNGLKRS